MANSLNCGIVLPNTKVIKEIELLVGSDVQTQVDVYTTVMSKQKEFEEYFSSKHPRIKNINYETTKKDEAHKIAKAMKEFYKNNTISVSRFAKEDVTTKVTSTFGYTNDITRQDGLTHTGNFLLKLYVDNDNKGIELPSNKYKYYQRQAKRFWLETILDYASKHSRKSLIDLRQGYIDAENKTKYIDDLLGGKDKNITQENYFAVYKELNASDATSLNFINEVLADKKLIDLYNQAKRDIDEEATRLALNAAREENEVNIEDSVPQDEELDGSIHSLNNHVGLYNNYLEHVGPRIRNYFNTLSKRRSTSTTDLDTSNIYGIPFTMDATECCAILYNSLSGHNVSEMIEEIRQIGNTYAGFEAFIKFAEDLENDIDFATEIFTTFAKFKIKKVELRTNDGKASVVDSNPRVNKRSAFRFDLYNDIRNVCKDSSSFEAKAKYKELSALVTTIENNINLLSTANKSITKEAKAQLQEKINNDTNTLKKELKTLIRSYFPSISENAIESYIMVANGANNNEAQRLKNISNLLTDINANIDATERSKNALMKIEAKIEEITAYNKKLLKEKFVDRSKLRSIDEAYEEDYIDANKASINQLAEKLLPYSIVETDLNSRTIHGNNESNIINSSMITKINKMLEDNYEENGVIRNKTLEAWGKKKLRSKQYKYSNILLEQIDEKGNVINKGIFRYVGDTLTITEYAKDLISIELFAGSSNMDSGTNMAYAEMTEGDYLPSDYMQFFTASDDISVLRLGRYFLRTPSDAPKTFSLKAPRYDTSYLFVLEDPKQYEQNVKEIVQTVGNLVSIQEASEKYINANEQQPFSPANSKYLNSYVLNTGRRLFIKNSTSIKYIDEETKEAYVTFITDDGSVFVLKGTVERKDGSDYLINANYEATVGIKFEKKTFADGQTSVDKETLTSLPDDITNVFTNYYKKELLKHDVTIKDKTYSRPTEKVNTDSIMFKMLKNQFKQEMLDAAVALDHYFVLYKTKDGYYKVQMKDDGVTPDNKTALDKGYKFYHLNKDGKVLTKKEDGSYTLDGKVFHSNKFALTVEVVNEDGSVSREPVNFLDALINNNFYQEDEILGNPEEAGMVNFLYGGALQIHKDENTDKVVDVSFSEELDARVEEALTKFAIEYRNQAIENINNYEDFIQGVPTTSEHITEFAFNNLVMHFNYDELFDGSTKFYKDTQTVLKRVKQVQGSGVPYGIADYSAEHEDDLSEVSNSFLNNGTITKEVKEIVVENGKKVRKTRTVTTSIQDIFNNAKDNVLANTRQRNGFHAVTVKNSISTNTKALNVLVDKLVEQGLDENSARDILFGPVVINEKTGLPELNEDGTQKRRGGFTETKVNDAQSYITFQEWVRRISARGQLKKYMPLIEKILDPDSEFSAEEIKEFIQVQKNFYYDIHYDEAYGIEVPRQIKNAEFVLIPRFIKGTQLEQVHDMMIEAGIDQLNTVETSKASNEEVLTLWDNDGNISDDVYENFVSEAANNKKVYSYNHLYTQQDNPQHMNSTNKAGIQVVKKMFDNIPEGHPLAELKHEYFRIFAQNIADSYTKVCNEFGIELDENGDIVRDSLNSMDLKVFYDRLKEEMMRTGIDNNLLDYVTIPENSTMPSMPSFMNNILTKFESCVQSMFNSNITRQKLPGFHASQVTNIGWRANPLSNVVDSVSYSKDLKYHLDENDEYASYIEIMIPYSALGIDVTSDYYKSLMTKFNNNRKLVDEQILKDLASEGKDGNPGLDKLLGYRIPTEGKQSVCNMKIVGFLDSSYGSTIVVPNDWVSQTGSDFDIDSVYSIMFNTYKTANGQIKKVQYKKELTAKDYIKYIEDKVIDIPDETTGETINETFGNFKERRSSLKSKINELFEEIFNNLQENEQNAWNNFNEKDQSNIKLIQDKIKKAQKKKEFSSKKEKYIDYLEEMISFLSKQKQTDNIKNYIDVLNSIHDYLTNYNESYKNAVNENVEALYDNHIEKLSVMAKQAGYMTYEEFTDPANIEKANSRQARCTRIAEIMYKVLESPTSLEENLSRSNFDDIVYARNQVMSEYMKVIRQNRSAYNVFDQIAFQEDAMSGAKLKARSVILDTFCSVCNTVQPNLEKPIYIVYNVADFKDAKQSLDRFGTGQIHKNGKTFAVRHDKYGWSKDNKNITGKLLTAYSSQTTALILDAIKEGNIPNVNDFTFSAFKTLVNVGSDYKTACAFIMSPGVTEIVKQYNKTKSVFSNSSGNEIHNAIIEIANRLNINTQNRSITQILQSINKQYGKEFNKLFKQDGDEDIIISLEEKDTKDLPIIVQKLLDRISEQGVFKNSDSGNINKALFDLGTILIFNNINKTANAIDDIAKCTNPDKFGAKQTVYATRQVFDQIDECLFTKGRTFIEDPVTGVREFTQVKELRSPILSVEGKHILEAIYPGISDINGNKNTIIDNILKCDVSASRYPTLCAFLKYASALSTVVAKEVFETQNEQFVDLVEGVTSVFSGYSPKLTEDTYNDVQKYILSALYNNVDSIKFPVQVRQKDGRLEMSIPENQQIDEIVRQKETSRIYGYNHNEGLNYIIQEEVPVGDETRTVYTSLPFEVKDINNVTDEEMQHFELLSPAQKVKWIQTNFNNAGIFDLLNVSLYNASNRGVRVGMQTLEYRENTLNSNIVYNLFKEAFNTNNPLILSTAIDIIKYAVQVEGMRMSSTAINKIIDNDCLINAFNEDGIGFIDSIRTDMSDISSNKSMFYDQTKVEELYENYLRSHPDCKGIKTIYTGSQTKELGLYPHRDGMNYGMYITTQSSSESGKEESEKAFNKKLERAGIKYYLPLTDEYKTNKYVRIATKKDNKLYKIKDYGTYIILYPLPNLAANENSKWSSRDENNRGICSKQTYEKLCRLYQDLIAAQKDTTEFVYNQVKEFINDETNTERVFAPNMRVNEHSAPAIDFNLQELGSEPGTGLNVALNKILDHFGKNGLNTPLYIQNLALSNYIVSPGESNGSTQSIRLASGVTKKFVIYTPYDISKVGKWFLEGKNPIEKGSLPESLQEIVQNAKDAGRLKLTNTFVIVPVEESTDDDEAYAAQFEEVGDDVLDFASSLASRGVEAAVDLKETLKNSNVSLNKDGLKDNPAIAIKEMAKMASTVGNSLIDKFDRFIVDEDDESQSYIVHKMDSDTVQYRIMNDEKLQREYLQTLNQIQSFLDVYSPFISLNVDSEDADIKYNLDKIKKSVEKVQVFPVKAMQDAFNHSMAAKLTTNPTIMQGLIDVMDGYWRTYGHMWQFNDIMENGNPLLQIVLKDVMGDIDAKQKAQIRNKRAFLAKIKEVINIGAERGEKVDWNKLVDKEGRFQQDYSNEFIDKLFELRDAVKEAVRTSGAGSIAHLKAKLEYDKFKANYVNQEAVPEYYQRLCQLEETVLTRIPELFSEYTKLSYKRAEYYDIQRKDELTEEQANELNRLNREIYNLKVYGKNSEFAASPDDNVAAEQASLLNQFINEKAKLNEETFDYKEEEGFREQLTIHLNTIERLEDRDRFGVPRRDPITLSGIPEYVKAKEWIEKNARFAVNIAVDEHGNPSTLGARINAALGRLKNTGKKGVASRVLGIMKEHNNDEGIYDAKGIPDGRKLSDDELAAVKEAQQDQWGIANAPEGTDRILISNAHHSSDQYSREFYAHMTKDGYQNTEYLETVTELNKLLEPFYSNIDGVVHLERISDDAEGIELINKIATLYDKLQTLKKTDNASNEEEVDDFIKENVEFVTDTDLFNFYIRSLQEYSDDFKNAFIKILYSFKDGNPVVRDGQFVPNRFLFSYAKPKGNPGEQNYDRWVDNQRSEDLALVNDSYRTTRTIYYQQALQEARRKAAEDPNFSFEEWYDKNHVYNPYTRKVQPLDCWLQKEIKYELFRNNTFEGKWVAKGNEVHRQVKDGNITGIVGGTRVNTFDPEKNFKNPNYKPNLGHAANYRKGINPIYDNNVTLNDTEKRVRDLIQNALLQTARTAKSQSFFKRGYLPRTAKAEPVTAAKVAKEAGKLMGIGISSDTGKSEYQKTIGYEHDFQPDMPMTELLGNAESAEQREIIKTAKKAIKLLDENSADYTEKLKEQENIIEEAEKKIQEINNALLNRDWLKVVGEYLDRASRYNAILDNKDKLYHLLNVLKTQKSYMRKYGSYGNLKETRNSDPEDPSYETAVDTKLVEQYETFLRRLFFDQWKEPEGRLNIIANNLQSFASANYMMLNFRGGIANVTLGETGILAEAAAKDFFGWSDWGFATKEWSKGIIGYGRRGFSMLHGEDVCYNKQDAIIQYMNVVDYDETTGVVRELSMEDYSKKVRDLMFSPQTAGEHFMQNSVMFAMLRSHKIFFIQNDGSTTGRYVALSKNDYIHYRQAELLQDILTEEQLEAFNDLKKNIKADKNTLKDYAWFRKDVLTDFIYLHCSKEQREQFIKARKEQKDKILEEWNEKADMYSQMELGSNSKLAFKEGSDLAELHNQFSNNQHTVSDAEQLLGHFSEKIRKVNNHIHGVYNRFGAADIEKKWYGSLVMQYHKHLPMGLLKRYRNRGYWNETRMNVNKGIFQSMTDLLSLNLRKIRVDAGLTDEQIGALESFTYTFAHITDYLGQIKATWNILPDYDKANIARNLGDLVGTLGAMATVAALWYIADDDDEMQDSLAFNLALYEADRLCSEAFMYNPLGGLSEVKKLFSCPVAAQSIVTDAFNASKNVLDWAFDEDYDPTYKTGRFAGESKLSVYVQRRIPIWNGIRGILDTPSNNHYYKLAQNPTGFFNVKEAVTGHK